MRRASGGIRALLAPAAGLLMGGQGWSAQVQPPEPAPLSPPAHDSQTPLPPWLIRIDPARITGRTFLGVRFDVPVVEGALEFQARRTWAWDEREPPRPETVRRLMLDTDVRVRLGPMGLRGKRAAVWLAPLSPDDPDAGPDVWQVFVVLEQGESVQGAISLAGERVRVRGVIRAPAGVRLHTDHLLPQRPDEPFVARAERLLARHVRRLISGPAETSPAIADAAPDDASVPSASPAPPGAAREEPIFAAEGVFTFSAGEIVAVRDEGERALLLDGQVVMHYWEPPRAPGADPRTMQISAQRGVVFLAPEADVSGDRLQTGQVEGVYLEGDVVASDGEHTLRAPRLYYSVRQDRGVLVDAVYHTFDIQRGLPLYARARVLERLSRDRFRAREVRLSTTALAEPDLAIGASTITLTRQPGQDGRRLEVDARDITLRAWGVPFFYWPLLRGDPAAFPLRDVRLENVSGSGTALRTTWDLPALLGLRVPDGTSVDLHLDGYFRRGVGLGTEARWHDAEGRGHLFAYAIPSDEGTDVLASGARRKRDGETRGMVLGEHRTRLGPQWDLFLEGAYISDETFIDGLFDPLGRQAREFTNAAHLRRLDDHTLTFLDARARLGDFLANQDLLQTPGYTIDRYPDAGYVRVADDLLDDDPGLVTYTSSYRFTHMRMRFADSVARDLGYRSLARAQSAFGIGPDESIADALRARGLTEEPVARFDTRHVLTAALTLGPVNLSPALTGRITAYDDAFGEFSPDEPDRWRAWGSAGITASCELVRVDNAVQSRVLDLHRIRHIVQPSIALWTAASTVARRDLPVFDDEVESLAQGSVLRVAVDQTWQTQRGGTGAWRSVDVLRLNAALVMPVNDGPGESPIGRWLDYRPELSVLGHTFGTLEGAWQVTEVLGVSGVAVYDLEHRQPAMLAGGCVLQHTPRFSTYAELRGINAQDQTTAVAGATYDLTRTYALSLAASYDTDASQWQSVALEIRRRLPSAVLGLRLAYNDITNETSVGVVLEPMTPGSQDRPALPGAGLPEP